MGEDKYYITKQQIDEINELARLENDSDIKKLLLKVQKKQKLAR